MNIKITEIWGSLCTVTKNGTVLLNCKQPVLQLSFMSCCPTCVTQHTTSPNVFPTKLHPNVHPTSVFTSFICSGVVGLSDVSHGIQLFNKVRGEQARFTVKGAVPPALFYLCKDQVISLPRTFNPPLFCKCQTKRFVQNIPHSKPRDLKLFPPLSRKPLTAQLPEVLCAAHISYMPKHVYNAKP